MNTWPLLLALVLSLVVGCSSERTPVQVAELARHAVVEVRVSDGRGTGFAVSPQGYLVTAYHVMRVGKLPSRSAYCVPSPGVGQEPFWSVLVAYDESHDLALLYGPCPHLTPLSLTERFPVLGEPVSTMGSALSFHSSFSTGIVSGLGRSVAYFPWPHAPALPVMQVTVPLNPGNSGGPLLDSRGRVLGMATAVQDANNIGFAISSVDIADFLRQRGPR
jgi:S1-C subfamily serine protease